MVTCCHSRSFEPAECDQFSLKVIKYKSKNNDSFVNSVGGVMLSATVVPPDVNSKLTEIAANEDVSAIEYNEPLTPITIPKSYFH